MRIAAMLFVSSMLLLPAGRAALPPPASPAGPHRIGTIAYAPIREASGLAPCRSSPHPFWVLNDSGNPPFLYLVDRTGRCLAEYAVEGAGNIDWEALASDGQGSLYIGDIGNNTVRGGLPVRLIYQVREPQFDEPASVPDDKPVRRMLKVQAVYTYSFPGARFDAEAMFCRAGRLYIVSKMRSGSTSIWEVPTDGPGIAQPLRRVCSLPLVVQIVTDASLSPDGRQLALCSYEYTAIFALDPAEPLENLRDRQPQILRHVPPLKVPTSIEACCWSGPDELLLAAEGGPLYRLAVSAAGTQPAAPQR